MENLTPKARLEHAAAITPEAALRALDSAPSGLTEAAVLKAREAYGANIIKSKKRAPLIISILKALIDPFVLILLVLAVVSFVLNVSLAPAGEKEPWTVVIILVMVATSVTLQVIQEAKSQRQVASLTQMVKVSTTVVRDGELQAVDLADVVVGDVIKLASGDIIPADARILSAKDLFLSEASMTGESEPVEKSAAPVTGKAALECENLVFMGTNVLSGTGRAVVVNTGQATIFGEINRLVHNKAPKSAFDLGISKISWLLIRLMAITVPFILIINGLVKKDWLSALLFALSIAVGLTPEMLPMIVTTSLAKGAVKMAKHEVIFKELGAIQNFGAMDILCTDKTGTLTKNKIIVEHHHNVAGEVDVRVLQYAFLNSYYQTGLRNLIDLAIIGKGENLMATRPELKGIISRFDKIDEIPFDFQRKRMSVILRTEAEETLLVTKGAVEEMLAACSYAEYLGKVRPLDEALKTIVLRTVNMLNDRGLRVIAVAKKTLTPDTELSVAAESAMTLVGYLSFLDPVKETSAEALRGLARQGITVKILTGDNERVTRSVAAKLELDTEHIILGSQLDALSDDEIKALIPVTNIYAKLSPVQKARLVTLMREMGHVVGFLGDGINDAPALKAADVGISVHDAVDIAKETAPVILLRKDLTVLSTGVKESRSVYLNLLKYIKITVASNFGNIFSVLVASIFLPFLPMLPLHLLLLNLIYDTSCLLLPWDNVDKSQIQAPMPWEQKSVTRIMLMFGPISSLLDFLVFALMYFFLIPGLLGAGYGKLDPAGQASFAAYFQTGWFVFSMISQTLVIHLMRTEKTPFIHSRASWPLALASFLGCLVVAVIPYTPIGAILGFSHLPVGFYIIFLAITIIYMLLTSLGKSIFIYKYKKLL